MTDKSIIPIDSRQPLLFTLTSPDFGQCCNMPPTQMSHPSPSNWVQSHIGLIRTGGKVLDLACGSGRHTRLLHTLGHTVVAADRNLSGVTDLENTEQIDLRLVDLETPDWPFQKEKFAGIIVTNYLYRPHLLALITSLDKDGVLIYATFAAGNEAFGRPRNPEFLLCPDELLDIFSKQLFVVAYEQLTEGEPNPAVRQRICATGLSHPAASNQPAIS
jgi:SAM-dependent methyltransferase